MALTDDDLSFAEGEEDELLGRLQRRLGKSNEGSSGRDRETVVETIFSFLGRLRL